MVAELTKRPDVSLGSMMSAPGIQYKRKKFAFLYQNQMVFLLGRDWKPADASISEWSHLSPFKNKPPLYDWFCITENDADLWLELAELSLERKMAGK